MSSAFIAVSWVSLLPARARAIAPMTNGSAIMMIRNVRSAASAEAYRRTRVDNCAPQLRVFGGGATDAPGAAGGSWGCAEALTMYCWWKGESAYVAAQSRPRSFSKASNASGHSAKPKNARASSGGPE
ncbi:hypothetical protein SMICM304S_06645 [Streptomyces microflavus]